MLPTNNCDVVKLIHCCQTLFVIINLQTCNGESKNQNNSLIIDCEDIMYVLKPPIVPGCNGNTDCAIK